MQVTDKETGRRFRLWDTPELREELAKLRATECKHEQKELCKVIVSGGSEHIKYQCQRCGVMIGNAISARNVGDRKIVAYQPDLAERFRTDWEEGYQSIFQKHIRIQKAGSGEFSKFYKEYINSAKWRAICRKVLQRANGFCEGCLERPPTQVHHRNYGNLGNEFMFELLALCAPCHERFHDQLKAELEAQGETILDAAPSFDDLDCQCRWSDGGSLLPQCGKFGVSVAKAIARDGECGPERSAHESFK
jgi:hypothetical protein